MNYKPGDIVQTDASCSGDFFVITGSRPGAYPYAAAKLKNGLRGYKLSEAQISRKVGELTIKLEDLVFTRMQTISNELPVRLYLNSLKYGDPITILHRGEEEAWTFVAKVPRGTKYVFSATNRNGTTYRLPLAALKVPKE